MSTIGADVPVLETARLRLRAHRVDDWADCSAMWGDEIVARYIGGKRFTPEETWSKILRYAGLWSLVGFGYWALEDKATGRFAGEVGFADFHRDITPPFGDEPESGWVLAPWAHGAGLATEAVRAALAWGDEHLRSPSTLCAIDVGNVASIRVAEKCGYRELARPTYKGEPVILFRRRR
jgi:RimJ/RimL family protein N-acetyltransferase